MTFTTIILSIIIFLLLIALSYSWNKKEEFKDINEKFETEKNNFKQQITEKEDRIKKLEAETLKYQLQPHTLMNLFAQMQALSVKLSKGWDSLSTSLEYIFHNNDNHFVTIKNELDFVRNYLTLNEVFLQHIDSVKLDIKSVTKEALDSELKVIPHLITAYLLENAFKHGDKTSSDFLKIKISADKEVFEIKVENKIKPSAYTNKRQGIGLKNMQQRLDLFIPEMYEIKSSCNEHIYISSLKIVL